MEPTPERCNAVLVIRDSATASPTAGRGRSAASPSGDSGTSGERTSPPAVAAAIPDRLEDLTASASVWTRALWFEHDRLLGRQQLLGYPVVAITAITGVAAFTQLNENPAWWATLTVAMAAGIAAVLSAIQTHGDFAARAQRVADSAQKFGQLLGEMLEAGEHIKTGPPPSDTELEQLYARYVALRESRPHVQPKLYREAQEAVKRQAGIQQALAEARQR